MDCGRAGESYGATVMTFHPGNPGAHRRLPGRRTIVPKRAYQPGVLYGAADGPEFPRQRLGGVLLYTVALLVGITCMCVCALPRDVLAGAILGSAWRILGVPIDGFVMNGIG